jgi:hypothetical protein
MINGIQISVDSLKWQKNVLNIAKPRQQIW